MRAVILVGLVMVVGCGGDHEAAPTPSEPTQAMAEEQPKAPEPPPPPTPPSPAELASVALDDGRYADVCAYLESTGFSEVVCAWLVDTIEANGDRSLTTDRLERFLRAHQVRRTSGTIVGWYDEGRNEYEARIGGRPSILVATETEFATTGRFTMWAQRIGTSTEVLVSGREVEVPVFREWPLYEVLIETARARGEAARPAALAAFRELVRGWESDYCYTLPEESSCYVDPNAPLPNVAPPTAETATSTLRAMIPSSLSSAGVAPVVFDVARFLHASNLRYDQLAEFPTTRLSELREDPEVRGKAWVATGTVSQVRASDNAVVFWRNDTCTYAVVPNAPVIPNRAEVRFAGIAVQHYRWPNLVGRPQDCLVAVGYFAPR